MRDIGHGHDAYCFGTEPNSFLKLQLGKLPVGKALFAAEGEGRNAIYAAKLGWEVYAFDISSQSRSNALRLARDNNVVIDYQIGELPELNYRENQFDVIVLVFAHFPAAIKSTYHKLLDRYLRDGGIIIFEAFSTKQPAYRHSLNYATQPDNRESPFSIKELRANFKNYELLELTENEITLQEGLFNNNKRSVIRFVGRKLKRLSNSSTPFGLALHFS